MVRLLHIADTHKETAAKLYALKGFVKEKSIDALLHTGDWLDSEEIMQEVGQNLQQLPQVDKGLVERMKSKNLHEEDNKKLQERAVIEQQAMLLPFANRYKTIDAVLGEIKKENPNLEIGGVLGNYDSPVAYEIMKNVKFAENGNGITIKGLNLKGMINTWEVPKAYGPVMEALAPYLTNYALGHDLSDFKDAKQSKVITELNKQELARLKSGKKPDLILMHKEPKDYAHKRMTNNAARQYLAENKGVPVLCGHYHTEYIGRYEDHPFIRTGQNVFYVIDFDEKAKKIKGIDIYAFVKKGSKRSAPKQNQETKSAEVYETSQQEVQKAA